MEYRVPHKIESEPSAEDIDKQQCDLAALGTGENKTGRGGKFQYKCNYIKGAVSL